MDRYAGLIAELDAAPPQDGWFTHHYGGHANGGSSVQADSRKRPWQIHNTRKLDGIREKIDEMSLSPIEKSVALTSLILALDKVDNTLGHHASYLKGWSPRSYNPLRLATPRVFENRLEHEVIRGDVFDAAGSRADLAYYDPPYGSSNEKMPPSRVRYASYYHLWTTVCLNDRPEVFGKAGRRMDTADKVSGSVFEEFRRDPETGRLIAVEAVERLIKSTRARWVLLSYGSSGRGAAEELNGILNRHAEIVESRRIDHKRNVMANMRWTGEWVREAEAPNQEFLFLIDKG